MGAILAFLKVIYEQKEKVILGILVLAFAGVAYFQLKAEKNSASDNNGGKNPDQLTYGDWKPAPSRTPQKYEVTPLRNEYPLATYFKLLGSRNIFGKPRRERGVDKGKAEPEWPKIRVKSVFDPTQSGSYIAIIEVDKRSRIVKEGQQFEGFEVRRIDGVRSCLTISKRQLDEEKEFCKEE